MFAYFLSQLLFWLIAVQAEIIWGENRFLPGWFVTKWKVGTEVLVKLNCGRWMYGWMYNDNINCFIALFAGLPGGASTRRNIHPLTPALIINHPLSAFSIYYDPPCSVCVLASLFAQPFSRSSLVYLLVWNPPLHTPYISLPNHCLLFITHARIIAIYFAVVPRLWI